MRIALILGLVVAGTFVLTNDGVLADDGSVQLVVAEDVQGGTLAVAGDYPFYATERSISDERLISVQGTPVLLALWNETSPSGAVTPHYAVSRDGQTFARARQTSYVLNLRYSHFDPLRTTPVIPVALQANPDTNELYIVQFITQPLEVFRQAIRAEGGTVYKFLNAHAYFVRMTPEVRDAVAKLSFVRWIGPVHPAFKLEEILIDEINEGQSSAGIRKFSIMVFERGLGQQQKVADAIEAIGGEVFQTIPLGFRLEAFMTIDQVHRIIPMEEIMFMDVRGELELDMDIAREISGANFIENIGGYTGKGVNAEVADTGLFLGHQDWKLEPIVHNDNNGNPGHGTSVYGICFGDGTGNANARGLLPDAQGIIANATPLRGDGNLQNRHKHTAELVDPNGRFRAIFQTNSTGDPRTPEYTTISAGMDDILFVNDIVHCQSMSNANRVPEVRPQAWAKNMNSIGGITHRNTLQRNDDISSGSSGPAKDGRIKPTLAHFYDNILTTASNGGYTTGFGGTSGATPITCGHFGLLHSMWDEGIFGNPFDPDGDPFDNRPHMTTAKAMLVNTAFKYPLNQGGLGRIHQGWGMVDLQNMFELRNKFLIIDETDVLTNGQEAVHEVLVENDIAVFAATMTYNDPAGVPNSQKHRINDLTLHVTSPSGDEYWGNNGLMNSNWSTTGGNSNDIDTVENVFVQDPEPGVWIVKVIADEINEDSHTETEEVDADYALVISGVLAADPEPGACCFGNGGCEDLLPNKCVKKGGRWNFRKECETFQCPKKGACCLDNSTCEKMLKRDCERNQGAIFRGEGVSCRRACVCDQIKRFKAKCGKSGTISALLKYRDKSHNGETVTFGIGERAKFEVTVRGKKARLFSCCYDGEQVVSLLLPEGCFDPIDVDCK